jgi:hypothetical protein
MYEEPPVNVQDEMDKEPTSYPLTKVWAIFLGVCALLVYWMYPNDNARGRAAAVCAYALFCAVRFRWNLRKKWWFWANVSAMAVVQFAVIQRIHWTNINLPTPLLFPWFGADLLLLVGFMKIVEKLARRGANTR